jgi:hypothetical protein
LLPFQLALQLSSEQLLREQLYVQFPFWLSFMLPFESSLHVQ